MAAGATESAIGVKPAFAWAEVAPLAALFGEFEFVKSLPSERDQNFLLRRTGGQPGLDGEEEKAVLKVHNPSDSAEFVDCQSRALEAAAQAGANCQRLLRTLEGGEDVVALPAAHGGTCCCRLLSFLPGRVLAEVAAETVGPEARVALWDSVGAAVGGLSAALQRFEHAAAHREFAWDLQRCEEVISAHVADVTAERRPLLERFLQQYRQEVVPLLPRLRLSTVHNDPNDHNLVVDAAGRVGVLDFGDMVRSYLCADAAICAAYLLLHCPEGAPLAASLMPFVRSFHARCPLEETEADALFGLAVARVCTSVCMSAYQSRLEPDNEYLLISAKPAWRCLERLALEGQCSADGETPAALLRLACGL